MAKANSGIRRIQFQPPELWPHQRRFVEDHHQFTVCKSATKCGKTVAAAWWLAREACRAPGSLLWWVGPTNDVGLIGYRTVQALLKDAVVKRTERPSKIWLANGSAIHLKSAQEPDFLRGAGVLAMALDEAGSPTYDDAWPEIRTTITQTRGKLKIIGNPGEAGCFFDKAETWGLDSEMREWSFHRWAFLDRPTATEEDLLQAKRELGEDSADYRRYYLGETIRGEGVFFYGLEAVAVGEPEAPLPGESYIVGVDCAIKHDYFVATVFKKSTRTQVAVSRHKGPPSEQQEDEIERVAKEYNDATVLVEVNGPGGPIYQNVVQRGVNAFPFETSGKSKPEILYDYRSDISRKVVTLLSDPYQLREHLTFQRRQAGWAGSKFGAPSGGFDDLVMANAIACHGMRQYVTPEYLEIA